IDRFFEESRAGPAHVHRLCDPAAAGPPCTTVDGERKFGREISSYRLLGQGLHLDIAGTQANGTDYGSPDRACAARAPVLDCNDGPPTAIYYNVTGANGRFYVDYWWFFRFNNFPRVEKATGCQGGSLTAPVPCSDHEGDWEGVTVVTSADDSEAIEYVAYAAHTGTFRYAAPQLDLQGPYDTRPIVYVANGSHASYPDSCAGVGLLKCRQLEQITPLSARLPEGRHDGLSAWGRNTGKECEAPPECLAHLPPPAISGARDSWNAYAGVWGRVCRPGRDPGCAVASGPFSPGQQERYQAPWCTQLVAPNGRDFRPKSCDVITPGSGTAANPGVVTGSDCQTWSGALAAVVACDAQTLASTLANDQSPEADTISIAIDGVERGRTATRGISQVVGKPIQARENITVRGRVSDLTVRARQPLGRRPKDYALARFTSVGLEPGRPATARVRYRDGRVRVSLLLPSGEVLTPVGGPPS
ncbi:MAG: hypothetical protein M3M99_06205, partial [Actinomycetota bacterium]|nr:hypothetical protein [Actinomycetota bacterium]